jgi:hypothetical protein
MSGLADFANPSTGKRNEPEKMLSGSQMCTSAALLLNALFIVGKHRSGDCVDEREAVGCTVTGCVVPAVPDRE